MKSFTSILVLAMATISMTNAFSNTLRSSCSVRLSSPTIRRTTAREAMSMRWGLKGNTANKITGDLPEGVTLRDTVPFEIRGFSLPLVVFTVGVLLTASSFVGYIVNQNDGGDGSLSSLGFVYGIPVFLIGLSLWYAEIPPVVVESSEAGDRAWEKHQTDTLSKIKKDVTRHRYGDDAHLDTSLEALGLKLPQKKFPRFQTIVQEETADGQLVFTMVFESLETPFKVWILSYSLCFISPFFAQCLTHSLILPVTHLLTHSLLPLTPLLITLYHILSYPSTDREALYKKFFNPSYT